MKVAISGSTGFLGKSLALELMRQNHEVLHITRNPSKCRLLFGEEIELLDLNQEDEGLLAQSRIFGVEVVIHTATHFSGSRRLSDLPEILHGTLLNSLRIFEISRHLGASFLNFNSMWQISEDSSLAATPYASAKEAFRTYLMRANLAEDQVIRDVFIPDTFGPGDTRRKLVQLLFEARRDGTTFEVRMPEALIDLAHGPSLASFLVSQLVQIRDLPRCFEIVHYPRVPIRKLAASILHDEHEYLNLETNFHANQELCHLISESGEGQGLDVIRTPCPSISEALQECLAQLSSQRS